MSLSASHLSVSLALSVCPANALALAYPCSGRIHMNFTRPAHALMQVPNEWGMPCVCFVVGQVRILILVAYSYEM